MELADLGGPRTAAAESAQVMWKRIERQLKRLHRKLLAGAKHFEDLPLEKQHRSRKQLKRLRYLAEFVGERWPKASVDRYLSCLEPLQDALGAHIDVATAKQNFLADAQRDQRSFFAVGFLHSELTRTAKDAGAALRRLRRAEPFWHARS